MARNAADSAKHLIRVLQQGGVAAENLYNTLTAGKKDLAAQLDRLLMDGASEAELLAFVRSQMAVIRADGKGQLLDDSLKSSKYQASSTEAFVNTITPDDVVAQAYNTSNKAVANMFSRPIGQKNISVNDLFSGLMTGMSRDVTNITKRAFQEGHTINEIASNIRNGMSDAGDDKSLRRKSEALARTAISKVANETRFEGFMANSDIVDRVLFVATLDGRTSDICMVTDGSLWALEDGNFEKLMEMAKTGAGSKRATAGNAYTHLLEKRDRLEVEAENARKAAYWDKTPANRKARKKANDALKAVEAELLAAKGSKKEEAKVSPAKTKQPKQVTPSKPYVDSETAEWVGASIQDSEYDKLLKNSGRPGAIPRDYAETPYYQDGNIHMAGYSLDSELGKSIYRHELGHYVASRGLNNLELSNKFDSTRKKASATVLAKNAQDYKSLQKKYPTFKNKQYSTKNMKALVALDLADRRVNDIQKNYGKDEDSIFLYVEDKFPQDSLARQLYDIMDFSKASPSNQMTIVNRLALAQERDMWEPFLSYSGNLLGNDIYKDTWGSAGHSRDLLSSLTRNEMGGGHSIPYYDERVGKKDRGGFRYKDEISASTYNSMKGKEIEYGMNTEAFANAFSLYHNDRSAAGRVNQALLKRLSPEMYNYMKDLLKKGGI